MPRAPGRDADSRSGCGAVEVFYVVPTEPASECPSGNFPCHNDYCHGRYSRTAMHIHSLQYALQGSVYVSDKFQCAGCALYSPNIILFPCDS